MATLEQLIGKPLSECSDEELEEIVAKGRLAREDEVIGARTKRAVSAKTEKKSKSQVELTLSADDLE